MYTWDEALHVNIVIIDKFYTLYPDGRVYSNISDKFLKQTLSKVGYYTYSGRLGSVHRLLVRYYLNGGRPIKPGMVVNHKDGIKINNDLSNLELVTVRQNTLHSYRLGLSKPVKGALNGMSKVTTECVIKMYDLFREGKCNHTVALMFGVHDRYVSLIRHGHRWKHIYQGPFPKSMKLDPMVSKYTEFKILCRKKWTNKAIALKLKIDPSTVSRWRSGSTRAQQDSQRLSPAGE